MYADDLNQHCVVDNFINDCIWPKLHLGHGLRRGHRRSSKYGITNTTSKCARRQLKDEHPDPCLSPQTHFYYYGAHPSTAAHKAVGDLLYEEALKNAP
jgi:phospholipase/lecithinase/hemolysin